MKRLVILSLLAVVALGALAVMAPAPALATGCVQCPVIEEPRCPACYQLVPGTCDHCAYCKRIPGCKA